MSEKLLPCPFCGGEAVLETTIGRKGYDACVFCNCSASVCSVTCDDVSEAEIDAIAAWNRRADGKDTNVPTNAQRIRGMSDEGLANELTRNPPIPCRMCKYWNHEQCNCFAPNDFTCVTGYAEALMLDWLQQPAETEGTE